jgi:hypothetical protein
LREAARTDLPFSDANEALRAEWLQAIRANRRGGNFKMLGAVHRTPCRGAEALLSKLDRRIHQRSKGDPMLGSRVLLEALLRFWLSF